MASASRRPARCFAERSSRKPRRRSRGSWRPSSSAAPAETAQLAGYQVAGKTGTASMLINGRYSHSEFHASFVGFVPSRRPAVTILVVIDQPHGKGYYGGQVAAPIFKRIAEATLRQLGVPPTVDPMPAVIAARRPSTPEVARPASARPSALIEAGPRSASHGLMPDLRGLSAREALRTLAQIGLAGERHRRRVRHRSDGRRRALRSSAAIPARSSSTASLLEATPARGTSP